MLMTKARQRSVATVEAGVVGERRCDFGKEDLWPVRSSKAAATSAVRPNSGGDFGRGQSRQNLMVLAIEKMVLTRFDGVCGDGGAVTIRSACVDED